jgi:hypothetical protein
VPHKSSKEFWKNSHFENMRAGFLSTLISLIAVEVGINVEGVQKLQNQKTWRGDFLEKTGI